MKPFEPIRTGRELALRMAGRFPQEDWIAELARRCGKSRDFVEWHLQEDVEPPPELLTAAAELLDTRERSDEDAGPASSSHLLTDDDLPFSGLPGNLGKLRKT